MTELFLRKKLDKRSSRSSNLDDSNQFHIQTHYVLKLHSKVKAAWKVLDLVNFSLYHDTADEILRNKPTFDQQKQNLIVIETFIEKIYQCGLTVAVKPYTIELRSVMLNPSTKFQDWNEVAIQVNKLLQNVCEILTHERDLEEGASFMETQGMESDVVDKSKLPKDCGPLFRNLYLWLLLLLILSLAFICFTLASKVEQVTREMNSYHDHQMKKPQEFNPSST
jgi:hypothetical protein